MYVAMVGQKMEEDWETLRSIQRARRRALGPKRVRIEDAVTRLELAMEALLVDILVLPSVSEEDWAFLKQKLEGDLDEYGSALANATDAASIHELSRFEGNGRNDDAPTAFRARP
jgi:hypothetical protein